MFNKVGEKMFLNELSNKRIKFIKSLKNTSSRQKVHSFLVEGFKNVTEAVNSDYSVEFIVVSDKFLKAHQGNKLLRLIVEKSIKLYAVSHDFYTKLSDTVSPQGIMAVVKEKKSFNDFFIENGLTLALDRIGDPGNMGTIIRTADAAGINGLILSKGCVDVFNPKVVRSTMGSVFHLPFLSVDDLVKALNEFKKIGGTIVTTHLNAHTYYYDIDYTKSTIIVMGQEDDGVSEEIVDISDVLVKIPMLGRAESLNVAIACGIILYEAVKQRIKTSPDACK